MVKHMATDGPQIQEIRTRLVDLLREVPLVRLGKPHKRKGGHEGPLSALSMDLSIGDDQWTILGEVKSIGEPRMIRGTIQQLQSTLAATDQTYVVIAAPYVGSLSQEICKEAGVGYLDLAGNCRLAFGPVFIERKGFPNPKAERRPLRTLFSAKASRILRVLLADPKRGYQLQELAREVGVSIGLAFKVKQRLLDLEYVRAEKNGIRLHQPERLLRDWAAAYRWNALASMDCFAIGEVAELEHALADYCRQRKLTYAFTQFSGAARVAPYTRYVRGAAYVLTDPDEVAKGLGWKSVSSGATFTLLRPKDAGLLYGVQEIDEEQVVSDIQLYLDLVTTRGRDEEAATFLLEQRIQHRW
jgi:hypothetical protein